LTGSPAEREVALAAEIEALSNIPVHNLAGQTNLKELLALCRGARLVIGPDSGTLHMSTTQGTPVIGLYAHSNPQRTGPYRDLHRVADAYTPALGDTALDGKEHRWGYRLKGPKLMPHITAQAVIELIDQALAEAR
jgi:heptosyltransferase I